MKRALAVLMILMWSMPPSLRAESGNVQIYGTINVDYENVRASGASPAAVHAPNQLGATPTGIDVPHRDRVTSNSSNIGFRGMQPLGAGLKAIFQIESGVGFDNQGTWGENTANGGLRGGGLATRNRHVGIAGSWGTAFLGQWDTPYKVISGAVDPMYFTGIAYTGAIIGSPGFGIGPVTNGNVTVNAAGTAFANSANASFERRQGNSVQYWTPAFDAFSAKLAYSVNEGKAPNSSSVTQINPRIWSTNLEYDKAPFYAALGYERHLDYFGLGAIAPAGQAVPVAAIGGSPSGSSRDTGLQLVGRYGVGKTRLGLIYRPPGYTQGTRAPAAPWFQSYPPNPHPPTPPQALCPAPAR